MYTLCLQLLRIYCIDFISTRVHFINEASSSRKRQDLLDPVLGTFQHMKGNNENSNLTNDLCQQW